MIAPGAEFSQVIVQAERENTQGAVGLVRSAVGEGGAPEVVVEQVEQWSLGQQILVLLDGSTGTDKKTTHSFTEVKNTQSMYFKYHNERSCTLYCSIS